MSRQPQLLMAKELADAFAGEGVRISVSYARAIIRACPAAIRRRYIRFRDAWDWWALNPDWRARGPAKKQQNIAPRRSK